MRLHVLISLLFASFVIYANDETQRLQTQLRIQPVGTVTVQSQTESDKNVVDGLKEKKESGQETYEQYCVVCHRDGLAGAPKFRNEGDWKPRLAGRTLDDLLASSIKGLNAMPIKGTCIKCSDDELKAAISYMLPKS